MTSFLPAGEAFIYNYPETKSFDTRTSMNVTLSLALPVPCCASRASPA